MKRSAPLKRYTRLARSTERIPQRRKGRRRGKVLSSRYLAWIRTQPCLVADPDSRCNGAVQAHHHGHCGQARANDYAAVPLCAAHHVYGAGPHAVHCLGKDAFEQRFELSFDVAIARLNETWNERTK